MKHDYSGCGELKVVVNEGKEDFENRCGIISAMGPLEWGTWQHGLRAGDHQGSSFQVFEPLWASGHQCPSFHT